MGVVKLLILLRKMAHPERFERPTLRFVASDLHFAGLRTTPVEQTVNPTREAGSDALMHRLLNPVFVVSELPFSLLQRRLVVDRKRVMKRLDVPIAARPKFTNHAPYRQGQGPEDGERGQQRQNRKTADTGGCRLSSTHCPPGAFGARNLHHFGDAWSTTQAEDPAGFGEEP